MRGFLHDLFHKTLILILLSCAALLIFRIRYHKAICDLARTQVTNATSDLINAAIDRYMETGNIQYDRIVYLEKDLDGRITALKTNISEVNRLKTDILALVNEDILALDTEKISIPIGSLLLPEFLSGRGFRIPVEVIAIRNSDGSFDSLFSEAGINQTRHQLTMEVLVDVTVLVLGKTESFTVNTHVVVAETIIVGHVPDTYLNTGG